MSSPINRRQFLKILAGMAGTLALANCAWKPFAPTVVYSGRLLGPSKRQGHALRDKHLSFSVSGKQESADVVIVGGGIAGLSAAWWLQKNGITNFRLLEMEADVGGNAKGGHNKVSAYPWGAHYVPLPDERAVLVRQLFEELGVIQGYHQKKPVYNELYLCHEPDERLFKDGHWQEGLVPKRGLSTEDEQEFQRFFKQVQAYKVAIGKDGKKAFSIPLDLSSADPSYRQLDAISMREWLRQNQYRSKPLHWYVDYCCKDDYGSLPEHVSAWAGIHYFAARNATAANAEPHTVLTWPEGNAWLVEKLRAKVSPHIQTNALVGQMIPSDKHVEMVYQNTENGESTKMNAKAAIFAGPRFIAKHLVPNFQQHRPAYFDALEYAPWVVANITLRRLPEGNGVDLAWDNVSYYSPSLGYVVATHQNIELFPTKTVLTYYWPLSHLPPKEARRQAERYTYQDWAKQITADMEKMHPKISQDIEALDVWVWGHGMIRPSVGYIWGKSRRQMKASLGRLHFAHSDMSGISIFEEAQYQGVEAAKKAINNLRGLS